MGRIIKKGEPGWFCPLPPHERRWMPINTNTTQTAFAWGDPGTESGHTINAVDADLALAEDGNGDQDHFLRFELDQTISNADANLTRVYRLQCRKNVDSYVTCPTTAGTNAAHIINHASITQGDDTTNRVVSSTATFLTNNNSVCDTSADTGSVVWTASSLEHIEVLISIRFNDANLAAGDTVDFRMIYDSDELLEVYTQDDATMTWTAPGVLPGDEGHYMPPIPEPEETVTVW